MFPQLAQFQDLALLLLRVMVAAVFLDSGWKHVKDPEARGKSIGMSKPATAAVGTAEILLVENPLHVFPHGAGKVEPVIVEEDDFR